MTDAEILHLLQSHAGGSAQVSDTFAVYKQFIAFLDGPPAPGTPGAAKGIYQSDDNQRAILRACALYIARQLQTPKVANSPIVASVAREGPGLGEIVKFAGVSLVDFCTELPHVIKKLLPYAKDNMPSSTMAVDKLSDVRELQGTVVCLTLAAKKYKGLLRRFVAKYREGKRERLGWLLFLVMKQKILPGSSDLLSCLELLTCIVAVLHEQFTPGVGDLETLRKDYPQAVSASGHFSVSKAVSDTIKLPDYEKVFKLKPEIDAAFLKLLNDHFPEASSSPQQLLKPIDAPALVEHLDELYREHCFDGELDERDFMSVDAPVLADPTPQSVPQGFQLDLGPKHANKLSIRRPTKLLAPGFQDSFPAPDPILLSPLPSHQYAHVPLETPISQHVASVSWIKQKTAPLNVEEMRFPEGVSEASVAQLRQRVQDLALAVMPNPNSSHGFGTMLMLAGPLAVERRKEAVKLFYVALKSMMEDGAMEGGADLAEMLSSSRSVAALMACSFELMLHSYRMAGYDFPRVLELLDVKAFLFGRIVVPFVQRMPDMPRELKRHMLRLVERVLESMAWEAGSALYTTIIKATRPVRDSSSEGTALAPAGEPQGEHYSSVLQQQLASGTCLNSPLKKARLGEPTTPAGSPASLMAQVPLSVGSLDLAPGDPASVLLLRDFLRKVLKLGQHRLRALVEDVPKGRMDKEAVVNGVYHVFEHALYQHTHLFYQRHVDVVLVCCIYGYFKVNGLGGPAGPSFREMLARYCYVLQSRVELFQSILLPGGERGEIIWFYNNVFLDEMRDFLERDLQPMALRSSGRQPFQQVQAVAAAGCRDSGGVRGGPGCGGPADIAGERRGPAEAAMMRGPVSAGGSEGTRVELPESVM